MIRPSLLGWNIIALFSFLFFNFPLFVTIQQEGNYREAGHGGWCRQGGGWGDSGEGWQEYLFCSTLRGLDMWKKAGRVELVHGNSEIIAYACNQTHTAWYGLRRNNSQEGKQVVDMKDWRASSVWPGRRFWKDKGSLLCFPGWLRFSWDKQQGIRQPRLPKCS